MFFGADYVERATLRDGTRVVLRLTVPDDKEILRRGFENWSAESRYARFLAPKSRLTEDELQYLCDVDQVSHFAIGAIGEEGDGHGESIGLGIARFIRLAGVEPPTAEAAVAVADEAHGKGLGRLLFLRLAAAAEERGIQRFRCEVLGSNTSMKGLIDLVSTERHVEVGSGVMSIDFAVPHVARDAAKAPDGGMYELIRAAAQAARMKKRAGS